MYHLKKIQNKAASFFGYYLRTSNEDKNNGEESQKDRHRGDLSYGW